MLVPANPCVGRVRRISASLFPPCSQFQLILAELFPRAVTGGLIGLAIQSSQFHGTGIGGITGALISIKMNAVDSSQFREAPDLFEIEGTKGMPTSSIENLTEVRSPRRTTVTL